MNRAYTDTAHVAECIRDAADGDEPARGRLTIVDAGQAVVDGLSRETLEERNLPGNEFDLIDDAICHLDCERPEWGGLLVELKFHEKVVEEPFELRPAGPYAIDAQQAVNPLSLGSKLNEALSPLVEEFDAIFAFNEVSAASIANGGHATDFEFEYDVTLSGLGAPWDRVVA